MEANQNQKRLKNKMWKIKSFCCFKIKNNKIINKYNLLLINSSKFFVKINKMRLKGIR